jgi:hypothetical protein
MTTDEKTARISQSLAMKPDWISLERLPSDKICHLRPISMLLGDLKKL